MPPTVRLTATVPAAKLSPVCATSIVRVSALLAFPEVRLIWVANRPGAGSSGAPTAVTMIWLKFGFAQFLLRVPVPPSVALHVRADVLSNLGYRPFLAVNSVLGFPALQPAPGLSTRPATFKMVNFMPRAHVAIAHDRARQRSRVKRVMSRVDFWVGLLLPEDFRLIGHRCQRH